MLQISKLVCTLVLSIFFLAGCSETVHDSIKGDDTEGTGDVQKPSPHRLSWDSIPYFYNPSIQEVKVSTLRADKLYVDYFGFKEDAEVIYSDKVPMDLAMIRSYSVWSGLGYWGILKMTTENNKLVVQRQGAYRCDIETSNGQITRLDGGCYVRLQIVLPSGSKMEVFNASRRLTKKVSP